MSKELNIVRLDTLANGSMASVDRENGILYLNNEAMSRLSRKQQEFVILHEMAHYNLDTSDELAADNYAAQIYYAEYGNLDEPIKLHKQLMGEYDPRVLALKRFKPAPLENIAGGLIASAAGSILGPVFNMFTSKQQGDDQRALQQSFERQTADKNRTDIELARLQFQSLSEGGVLGLQNTKMLVIGLIGLAVIVGLVLVLKDIID